MIRRSRIDLPVRLRLESDVETLVLEVAFFVGDGERRHVRQLDEAELDLLFELQAEACTLPALVNAAARAINVAQKT